MDGRKGGRCERNSERRIPTKAEANRTNFAAVGGDRRRYPRRCRGTCHSRQRNDLAQAQHVPINSYSNVSSSSRFLDKKFTKYRHPEPVLALSYTLPVVHAGSAHPRVSAGPNLRVEFEFIDFFVGMAPKGTTMRVFVDTNLTSGESVMLLVPGSTTVGELKVGIEV